MTHTHISENTEETPTFLEAMHKYDPLKMPEAQALIPLNPMRLPNYALGSIIGQNLREAEGIKIVQKPLDNLKIAKRYIQTATSPVEVCQRVAEVVADTLVVNAISEVPSLVSPVQGEAAAGLYTNQVVNRYEKKMNATDTETRRYILKKRRIKNNYRKEHNVAMRKIRREKPTIGNAGGSTPTTTIKEFQRNSTNHRPFFTKKFFKSPPPPPGNMPTILNTTNTTLRGGAQSYVIEIPTNQPHLLNTTKMVEVDYGNFIIYIIVIYILVKKISSRVSSFSKRKGKIFNLLKKKNFNFKIVKNLVEK